MFRFSENVIIQMTRDCNMHCKYCYEGHNRDQWHHQYIDFDHFKQIVDSAIYYRCVLGRLENPIDFHFHGGEVLLFPWDELKKDIEYIEERKQLFPNLRWCLQSNGIAINSAIAQYFAQRGISFGISFDGRHSTGRMTPEATDNFIKRLFYFNKEFGLRFSSLSVITKENMKYWLEDMREVEPIFDNFGMNVLCADYNNEDLVPTANEFWEYCYKPVLQTFLTDKPFKERNIQVAFETFIEQKLFGVPNIEKTGCFNKLCGHGANMTSISPDLKAHPCDKFLESGNYRENIEDWPIEKYDFLGLQQVNKYTHFYKEMFTIFETLGCHNCPANNFCPGDCQAFNISKNGKPSIDKSYCNVYMNIYNFFEENWYKMLQNLPVTLTPHCKPVYITPEANAVLNKNNLKLVYDNYFNVVKLIKKEN